MELSIENKLPTKSFTPRRLPRKPLPPEEIARRKAERAEFGSRCRVMFEKLRPQLIDQYYNWFIAVGPDSEDYLIDPSFEGLIKKVQEHYDDSVIRGVIFRLNEEGFCGRI
jgi:hypothetical protein